MFPFDDVTRAAASALLIFSPVLQWGLEPKRPVRIAPLVLDHRVFSCDIILDP